MEIITYCLLDWGGNVEEEKEMTAEEAKKANENCWRRSPRLLRWAPKDEVYTKKYGDGEGG